MQRKMKLLMTIAATALAVSLVVAMAGPAIAQWFDSSITTFTAATGTSSISTVITGVETNAMVNPIDIDGQLYSAPGGQGNYAITDFSSSSVSNTPNTASVATVSTSGWYPGDYVVFAVTITNNGAATLAINNAATYHIVASIGGTQVYDSTAVNGGTILVMSAGEFGQNTPASDVALLSGATYGNTWLGDNSWNYGNPIPTGPAMPAYLAQGQSFTYTLFIGLGENAPYNIGAFSTTVTINLPVAN
jgi:hypothetical protein